MKVENPFPVSGYLSPTYFCDREEELQALRESLSGNLNVTLFSVRRMGKTGLIRHFFYKEKKNFITLYFNIYQTENLTDFLAALTEGILQYAENQKSVAKNVWDYVRSIRPTISYDELTGAPSVSFAFSQPAQVESTLKSVLNFLENQPKKVVVAIDEFQQIGQYPEKKAEALLRTQIEGLKNVSFIFTARRKDYFFNDSGLSLRPLFASSKLLEIKSIPETQYNEFVKRKLKPFKKTISKEVLGEIMRFSRRHTFFTQMLLNRCFAAAEKEITEKIFKTTAEKILRENQAVFESYSALLTKGQRKLLEAIALEERLYAPQSKDFIKKHDLGAAASVRRALKSLEEKDLVSQSKDEKGELHYELQDVFLSRWLKHL